MRITRTKLLALISLILAYSCLSTSTIAQGQLDSVLSKLDPQKYASAISKKAQSLEDKLVRKSVKVLDNLQEEEEKAFRKLLKTKDSLIAQVQISEIKSKYSSFKEKLNNPLTKSASQYIPKLDSLNTSLQFLSESGIGGQVKAALDKSISLQDKFNKAEEIKKFIRERRQQLKEQFEKLGMVKQLKKINKEVYYYSQQINEYKEILKDSRKIEKKAMELLAKTKLFKDFMRKNSMLASMFRLPGNPDDLISSVSLAGLQTRAQVSNLIQQQIGPNGTQQLQQNFQSAQAQLNTLKNKILAAGGSSSEDEMPEFRPNSQKTKSFLKKLEFGLNVQSQKSTTYFPVTSDLGLSLGYKMNDKSIIGFGASYKLGWGRGWNNLAFTHQGVGFRSFIDVKFKGSFWLSGGYEQNYRSTFRNYSQLRDFSAWQQSGLFGISKAIPIKTKFFNKTNIKLLWDFLSYKQVPRTQPILFRIGYDLK